MTDKKKVFISHCWDYDEELKNLTHYLNKEAGFVTTCEEGTAEHPVKTEDEPHFQAVLHAKIISSAVVIVVACMDVPISEWMEWEIEMAVENNIPVIGVRPEGSLVTPKIIRKAAREIIMWDTESIVSAIKRCS